MKNKNQTKRIATVIERDDFEFDRMHAFFKLEFFWFFQFIKIEKFKIPIERMYKIPKIKSNNEIA